MNQQKQSLNLICTCILFCIFLTCAALYLQAQSVGNIQNQRQIEITSFWKTLKGQFKDIDKLDKLISESEKPNNGEQPSKQLTALMYDHGTLRPISENDRNLEPNHYMTLIFEKDFRHHTIKIIALDNQNSYRKSFIYWNGIETMYFYDDNYFSGYIAKSAKAFRNNTLIADAIAIKRIETTSPYQIEVQETHYDIDKKPSYKGTIVISLDHNGSIIKESSISGEKKLQIFDSWGTRSQ